MFSVNKHPPVYGSGYQSVPLNCTRLLPAERQHVNYLHSICYGDSVSLPIDCLEEAVVEVRSTYGAAFINEVTQLDVADEIAKFNQVRAFKKIHFIDWFAFRDFKEDGYVRINAFLREAGNNQNNIRADVFQIMLSAMHLIMLQANDPGEPQMLYRGEVRPSADTGQWQQGTIFTSQALMSASHNPEVAWSFLDDEDRLQRQWVNVLFEIVNDNPYSGAPLSEVLCDMEEEYLFLPDTDFIITGRDYNDAKKLLTLRMSTCSGCNERFNARLQQWVFYQNRFLPGGPE